MQKLAAEFEAFERGRERERHELHNILLRDARDGEKPNVNAIFLLKARHGYREGDPDEQPNRLNITFNLPGAMSRDDFLKTSVDEEKSYEGLADFELVCRELFRLRCGTDARYNAADHVWRFPGGGYFEMGQLESQADYSKYQGRSFTLLIVSKAASTRRRIYST